MPITVEFCGEVHEVARGGEFSIGRDADLVVDENPFLHRHFLTVSDLDGVCVLANVGDRLSATASDLDGHLEAYLAPGARLPLMFESTRVSFAAGPTVYELFIRNDDVAFRPARASVADGGTTTLGPSRLTPDQHLLIIALAEPQLSGDPRHNSTIPSSAEAANRLGWTITKFNRKLDNVCEKLSKIGVQGLHGDAGSLASNRRARLVEYAIATRVVTRDDVALIAAQENG